jgi:hypothetical protein
VCSESELILNLSSASLRGNRFAPFFKSAVSDEQSDELTLVNSKAPETEDFIWGLPTRSIRENDHSGLPTKEARENVTWKNLERTII